MSHFERFFLERRQKRMAKWDYYFDAYDRHLLRFVGKAPVIFEIGVADGGSLDFWRKSLGPGTKVVGIDIISKCKEHENPIDNIHVEIGDGRDYDFLLSVIAKHGRPNIVIDDGDHNSSAMMKSLSALWKDLLDDGVYIIEDLHGVFWQDPREWDLSIFDCISREIIGINSPGSRGHANPGMLSASLKLLACYWSLFIFEKSENLNAPRAVSIQNGEVTVITEA
jgi:hypothetical protein